MDLTDLTPGEKAVLAQIGALYREAAGDQLVRALTGQWLAAHYQPYSSAYAALITKRFIEPITPQKFRLTRTGLVAIGAATPPVRAAAARKLGPQPAPHAHPERKREARRSLISRFVGRMLGRR